MEEVRASSSYERKRDIVYKAISNLNRELYFAFFFVYFIFFAYSCFASIFRVNTFFNPFGQNAIIHGADYDVEYHRVFLTMLLLLFGSHVFSYIAKLLCLPGAVGMIIYGALFQLAGIRFIHPRWADVLSRCGLILVVSKSAFGLDKRTAKEKPFFLLLFSILPCAAEMASTSLLAHLLFGVNFPVALMTGAAFATSCPFMLQHTLNKLKTRGYMHQSNLPEIARTSSAIEHILAILVFSFGVGLMFSRGEFSMTSQNVLRILGIFGIGFFGILLGAISGYILKGSIVKYRTILFFVTIFGGFFLYERLGLMLAAYAAVYVSTLVFSEQTIHKQEEISLYSNGILATQPMSEEQWLDTLWMHIFGPLLFAFLGTEIPIEWIRIHTVAFGLVIAFIAVLVKTAISLLTLCGSSFDNRYRLFISVLSLHRSSIQAALALIPLDMCGVLHNTSHGYFAGSTTYEPSGCVESSRVVVSIATLAVLVLSSIGNSIAQMSAPNLLQQDFTPRFSSGSQSRTARL